MTTTILGEYYPFWFPHSLVLIWAHNQQYTAIPLETGQFYQQTGDGNVEMLEDADEWMYEVWRGFFNSEIIYWNSWTGRAMLIMDS